MDIKKIYIIILFVILGYNVPSSGQWQIQDSGVNVDLHDVCFIDENHGWAVGDSSTIIATTDGGSTWVTESSPVTGVRFNKVQFQNENVGYIVGDNGVILSTKDGGDLWEQNESGVDYILEDLSFVNADTGWVAGGDFLQERKHGVILRTTDGGDTWEIQFDTYSESMFSSKLFTAVEFVDENNGWGFAGDYVDNFSLTSVYRTSDGGEEWEINGTSGAPLSEISVAPYDTIWGGGWPVFAISTNGGIDWDYFVGQQADSIITVQDVMLLNGQTGWYLGAAFSGSKIRFTNDGGSSWRNILKHQIPWLNALCALDASSIWAVGDSGVVLRYAGNLEVINECISEPPQSFKLKQNYPNPFNSLTTIKFELPEDSFVELMIYNLIGKEIKTLIRGNEKAGYKNIVWNGKDNSGRIVSSGLYLYKLSAKSMESDSRFAQTRKMVYLR